jgi:hypothetical protein
MGANKRKSRYRTYAALVRMEEAGKQLNSKNCRHVSLVLLLRSKF